MESSSNTKTMEDVQQQRALSLSGPNNIKRVDSFIQIESISIDLPTVSSKNEKTPKCEHFSIRKYVSDMRQKDSKACWPFESNMKSNPELELKFSLPPIDVPKFRWWKCRNCFKETCQKENGKAVLVNDSSGECNSDIGRTCTHIALTGSETTVLVSDFKQILRLEHSADKSEPVPDTANESNALTYRDQKYESNHAENNAAVKVPEIGLEDNVFPESCSPIPNASEQETGDSVPHLSKLGNDKVNGVMGSLKNLQLQRDVPQDYGLEATATKSPQTLSATVEELNMASDTAFVQQNEHASDDSIYPSSDSDDVGPGSRSCDRPGALHRRKVRKVRLLSDLLGQNVSVKTDNKKEESLVPAISDASEECAAKKFSRRRKLKRKFFREDDYEEDVEYTEGDAEENRKAVNGDTFDKMSPSSVLKNGRAYLEDPNSGFVKKNKTKSIEVESVQHGLTKAAVSEMGSDAYPPVDSLPIQNGDSIKHNDEKKKSSKLAQESLDNSVGKLRGKSALDVSAKSHGHDMLMRREMSSSFSSALKVDRDTCMCAKKSKIPHGDDHYRVEIPPDSSSKFSEDPMRGVQFGLVQSGPATIQFLPDRDAAVNTGNVLPSYDGKTEAERALSFNYGSASQFPWNQVVSEEARVLKKNNSLLEPNYASSRLDNSFKKAMHHNYTGKEPIYTRPYPKVKKTHTSQFGDMGRFPVLQEGISGANKKREITGSREKSVAKKQGNKFSNESSARRTCSDDYPMDIVELMAKIQYENTLPDTVKDQTQFRSWKSPSYQNLRFGGEYNNGDPKLTHGQGSMSCQSMSKIEKEQGNAKEKVGNLNYSHHMAKNEPFMTQVEQNLRQNHLKGHAESYPRYPEKPSLGKRNEDPMINNYRKSSASIDGLSPCNMSHMPGTTMEPFNVWSSSAIPTARIAAQESRHDCILPSSGLKPAGVKASNKYEKPNKGFLLENSKGKTPRPNRVKVQSPSRSSDCYSNENIPAMHLLSLMDAHHGQTVNGNSRLSKQPSSVPCAYPPKEFNFGEYRVSEIVRRPSSDNYTINFVAPGKYNQHLSAASMAGASSSLFEPHENLRNGVMDQVPLKVREKGKKKCSDLIGSIGGSGSQNYASSGCITVYSPQAKELIGAPNSVISPPRSLNLHIYEKELIKNSTGSVWPPRYTLDMGTCTVNRNPAEFSVPEVGNVYTIGGSELRFAKRLQTPEWFAAPVINLERPKRGRKKKIATAIHQQPGHPQVL